MNGRSQLAVASAGLGVIGVWLPDVARATVEVVCGFAVPAGLWWDSLRRMRSMSDIAAVGVSPLLVMAWWCLVTLALLAVGVPLDRLAATISVVVVVVVAYCSGLGRIRRHSQGGRQPPIAA